jgi:hypothetical protein
LDKEITLWDVSCLTVYIIKKKEFNFDISWVYMESYIYFEAFRSAFTEFGRSYDGLMV